MIRTDFRNSSPTSDDLRKIAMHIQQDCAEKVDEVQLKAEEEFKHEKMREILLGYARVDEDYRTKEARVRGESFIFESKMKNNSRLKILEMKYEQVEDVMAKAKLRLANKDLETHHQHYRHILKALIMQGLCKLVEPKVTVYCRKMDVGLVSALLAECAGAYTTVSSLKVDLSVGQGRYLASSSEGGLLLATREVSLDNTLASRLETVCYYLLPEVAGVLFGEKTFLVDGEELTLYKPAYLPPLAWLQRPVALFSKSIIEEQLKESSF